MVLKNILIFLLIGLTFNSLKSQSFFDSKSFVVNGMFGPGKISYYFKETPSYIVAADQDAVAYSPSWSLSIEKFYWLNSRFNFSLALSYLSVSKNTSRNHVPSWFDFNEKLSQGFIHLIPNISMNLPDDNFRIIVGAGIGSIISERESSNAVEDLDFTIESGFSIKVIKQLFLEIKWIQGLTKYDYRVGMPVHIPTYFKYHSFQFGIQYVIHENK